MVDVQRSQWLLSMPACGEMNQAVQDLTGIGYHTSEQHKEESQARQKRDKDDILTVLSFIKDRDPFKGDDSLRNIENGITADSSVNADSTEEVGKGIIQSLVGKNIMDYTFRKKQQLITLGNKTSVKIDGELVEVDPQLLFQRCTAVANTLFDDISVIFQYELCSVPFSLFDSNGEAHKSVLFDSIWNLVKSETTEINTEHVKYVLDGGSLIHRKPWVKGQTFSSICESYVQYVIKHYADATIVFDGYPDTPTLKDVTHVRRTKGILVPKVEFTADMPCRSKKKFFLSNSYNKQRFIKMLSLKLEDCNYKVVHAPDDADVTIVQTPVQHAQHSQVIVIGEDTDLLVILCSRSQSDHHNIYFKSEPKQSTLRIRIWDINKTKEKLGKTICNILPVIHAFTGCDTVSHIFGHGKGAVLKKNMSSQYLQEKAMTFLNDSNHNEIAKAGEKIFLHLYGGLELESLDLLRYRKFASKVLVGNIYVQVHSLSPTSNAAKFHSLRTFYQSKIWIQDDVEIHPIDWGWYTSGNKLLPIRSTLPPAPDKLLKTIRCNCKQNCDSKRCTCRKHGIDCSIGCGEFRGINCTNSPNLTQCDLTST
ncbi:Hypothetical predicted protein [Mytilus galloprovincialis]|uniref:Tesmin/TSO1-like CXC domain-containing protein n=1 Tax=Mytilus galloprovincialis TaxID=29158 RepID=A0A8B6CXC5_MYTGA|nr:Hypothetical predicted protein [Mytilus galloprovincialis]